MRVSNTTARKISNLVRPIGFIAAPETIITSGYDLPLLALTNQATRELSVAIRIRVSAEYTRRWTEAHTYTIRDLIDYARHLRRPAHIVVSGSLKEGTSVKVIEARTALTEAIATVTTAKLTDSDTTERRRWEDESRDLLND